MSFAASVTFKRVACARVSFAVAFPVLMSFVTFNFVAFRFEVAKHIAVETKPLFGVLGSVSGCFTSAWGWVASILFKGTNVTSLAFRDR